MIKASKSLEFDTPTAKAFEELPAKTQELEFNVLKEKLGNCLHLKTFNHDTLKTLELYKNNVGINNAGELLADTNSFTGIDIVRFGNSINIILDRETYEHQSILLQYDKTILMYRRYYQYDEIKGMARNTVTLIPEEAFREAVANAIVHRTWDVASHINIAMFPDKIEITSPGGLPKGMYEDEYYKGGISVPRNRIIANIFLKLQLIERFGTGIMRIQESYSDSQIKPVFDIGENSIRITLPVLNNNCNSLTEDEATVFHLIKGNTVSSSSLVKATGFGKTKILAILNKLINAGYIKTTGSGKSTKYITA